MKIAEIILKSVNNFSDFEYNFRDEWTQEIPSSLLLMGPNGSGKTTILNVIAGLWGAFGGFLENPDFYSFFSEKYGIRDDYQLIAMKIEGFLSDDPKDIWICSGSHKEVVKFQLKHEHEEIPFLNFIGREPVYDGSDDVAKDGQMVELLRKRFLKNQFGYEFDLPNIVFLESENRRLLEIEGEFSAVPEKKTFNWLSRYQPTAQRKGHIENVLFTLKAVDTENFYSIVETINQFLTDKQITDFDRTTARLMVETDSGEKHPIHRLSSGEKQMLLMITFVSRELQKGGILLIDEPGLHLHVSMANAFVDYFEEVVREREGQLIIASHSPELWEQFIQSQRVKLGVSQ